MKKSIYLILICFVFALSCKKNSDSNNSSIPVKNEIQVKVYNANTWNSQTNKLDTIAGATIYLICDSITVFLTSNNNGIATFNNITAKTYYITATKDSLSNLLNKATIDGKELGYLVKGVYNTQTEANLFHSAIGDLALTDVNNDGIINDKDKVQGQPILFEYKFEDLNLDGIINDKDKKNGQFVKIDNLVEVNIFIGKLK